MDNLLELTQRLADQIMDRWPAPAVTIEHLQNAQLVAHRGCGPGLAENQLPGFFQAQKAGVWALEFDVRWSQDEQPVILHDEHSGRVFGSPARFVKAHSAHDLCEQVPGLLTLSSFLEALGPNSHYMIEIKEPLTAERENLFCNLTRHLEAGRDFHLLTLNPEFLMSTKRLPRHAFILVAELNVFKASQFVIENGWGGLAGHYLLLSDRRIRLHRENGQKVGVGHIRSFNNLCRQLGRQVDWVFSNHAVQLQNSLNEQLTKLSRDRTN